MAAPHCNALSSRNDFLEYMALLRNITDGDFSRVYTCRAEVCGALWGAGNPDISGIGMAIGYLLESSICASLICVYLWIRGTTGTKFGVTRLILRSAAGTFVDNAIFFTFAIQIASIVTLARANFGISTEGMGAITMKIAWVVSTLTLLPLLPLVLRPQLFAKDIEADGADQSVHALAKGSNEMPVEEHVERQKSTTEARHDQRFLLIVLCWALSFYPFFSRMAGTFSKQTIRSDPRL
jgi:hypothetical protein